MGMVYAPVPKRVQGTMAKWLISLSIGDFQRVIRELLGSPTKLGSQFIFPCTGFKRLAWEDQQGVIDALQHRLRSKLNQAQSQWVNRWLNAITY